MSERITGSNGERAAANFLFSVQLRLHLLMEAKGITRSELAARLGAPRSRVTRLLGAESNMTVATLARVCEALGEIAEFTSPVIRDALAADNQDGFSEGMVVTAAGDEAADERFAGENVVYLDEVRVLTARAGLNATEMELAA